MNKLLALTGARSRESDVESQPVPVLETTNNKFSDTMASPYCSSSLSSLSPSSSSSLESSRKFSSSNHHNYIYPKYNFDTSNLIFRLIKSISKYVFYFCLSLGIRKIIILQNTCIYVFLVQR